MSSEAGQNEESSAEPMERSNMSAAGSSEDGSVEEIRAREAASVVLQNAGGMNAALAAQGVQVMLENLHGYNWSDDDNGEMEHEDDYDENFEDDDEDEDVDVDVDVDVDDEDDQDFDQVQTAQRGAGRGCTHYSRGCKLVSPCCGEHFWCRFCHDASMDQGRDAHKLDRHAVQEVVCGDCGLVQPVSQQCIGEECTNVFGDYFCRICNFFDDDLRKQPYHCDGCGICRVGGRENFFHCETCACCYAVELRNNHRCIQDSMHQNCPICQEDLFTSTAECRVLRCGHTMHRDCLRMLMEQQHWPAVSSRCPLCYVSIGDSSAEWAQMDRDIALNPMPEELKGQKVAALCNDCHHTGETKLHFLGLKCCNPQCGGYNTRQL